MRSALWGIVVASSTLTGWLALGAGCGALPTECAELYNCPPGGGGSSSSSTSTTTTTTSGTGGGPPSTCVPTAGMAPVADTCGIFVSSSQGDDLKGAGTSKSPYKTLGVAIAAAGTANLPVYACAETFTEAVSVADGVGIYGGLDCTKSWVYKGDARSTLTAGADAVPLTLSAAAKSFALFDFNVQAVDAVIAGGSSIAVIADQVTASFTRCDLIAGNGKDGAAGTTPTDSVGPSSTFDSAIRGNDGTNACMNTAQSFGGAVKDNAFCPNASGGPLGGSGGPSGTAFGSDGATIPATMQTALGGKGQPAADPLWDCIVGYGLANGGTKGSSGVDGDGATGAAGLGQLSIAGYAGVSGMPGDAGKPGQGGGGGGGAKGKTMCAGATGGGGGAGGCGGHGGTGGSAGGASIGLVSLDATLAFDSVTIKLGKGGSGGDGAFGQGGGIGGKGGTAGSGDVNVPVTSGACDGGNGGSGGSGGHGGGGRGGHAIGIAYSGKIKPVPTGASFPQKGAVGPGGTGGPSHDGDPGVLAEVQMFP